MSHSEHELVFPEQTLNVVSWPDPVLDQLGHDPRSLYVERYWLPILGPSCLMLVRRFGIELVEHPDGFELDTVAWARALGVGVRGGKNGPFWRAVLRACRFGSAQRNGQLLAVRRRLPPLTSRQVERLPQQLQVTHQDWLAQAARPPQRTITKWSPRRTPPPIDPNAPTSDAA